MGILDKSTRIFQQIFWALLTNLKEYFNKYLGILDKSKAPVNTVKPNLGKYGKFISKRYRWFKKRKTMMKIFDAND